MKYNLLEKTIENLSTEFRIPLILAAVYAFFHKFFEEIFTKYLVTTLLSKYDTTIFNEFIWYGLIIVIIIFAYNRYRLRYYIGIKLLLFCSLLLGFYLFYRIDESVWLFIKSPRIKFIAYLDIVPLLLLSYIINYPLTIFAKKDKHSDYGFAQDNPLDERGTDLLNREPFAKFLSEKLIETDTSNNSFAVGIASEWGSGKTSFINLIKRYIDNQKYIIINFNPWLSHDSKSIIRDFFNSFNLALRAYNSDISAIIEKYYGVLTDVDDTKSSRIFSSILNISDNQKNSSDEFQNLDNAIKNIKKRIFIFIDDIDRLYKYEIVEVIKIIRNSASFSNTSFIVTYDRNYIINAIEEINNYYPEYYLEKIFQIEIQLPRFDEQIIKKRLLDLINPSLSIEDKEIFKGILFMRRDSFGSNNYFLNKLTTLRDVTRFANSFLIAYSFLKGEIKMSDLLNLEALRLKYPGVYKLIFFHPEDFLETIPDEFKKTKYSLRKEKSENQEKILLKEYLQNNYKKIGLPENQIENAIYLVHSLFPDPNDIYVKSGNDLLSIRNPASFERYSHYRLLDSDISEIEFSKVRSGPLTDFQERIKFWSDRNLQNDLRRKLSNINSYYDRDDYEKVIKAIFFFARLQGTNSSDNGYDYEDLFSKISDYDGSISSKYYSSKDDFEKFILSIFETAPSPYIFESEFIYQTFDKYSISYNFIIPKNDFERIRLSYFEKYLKETNTLDDYVWSLYHNCNLINAIPESGSAYTIQKKRNPEASKLFIDFIKEKAVDEFLASVIAKEPFHDNLYAVSNLIPDMFDSWNNFNSFLESLTKIEYKYLDEFQKLFNKFSENNFKTYVEFKFEILPKPR
jgi:hypothetical protein